ncbi:MAG: signal peptidase II [Xanthomonadales bacterium]|nr:signal peptidase II [Xanthomonadales bacterium]
MSNVKPNALVWLWMSAAIVIADQATKWMATHALDLYQSIAVFPGLNWTLLHNYGAAFSFLNIPGGAQRWLFSAIAIGISIALPFWLAKTPRADWRTAAPLALIIGGAIGNLIDRLRLGYVVDFIDVYYGDWHFPAFNIADSAVSVAAVGLILFGILAPNPSEEAKP